MTRKIGTWLIGIGSLTAFLGLCFLPAAFGPNGDRELLGAGSAILSMGILLISSGLYAKARALGAPASASAAAAERSRRSNCDRCGKNEPVIQCRVHQVHLCPDCLRNHYDFRSCAYVPSPRRGASKSAAASQASGA